MSCLEEHLPPSLPALTFFLLPVQCLTFQYIDLTGGNILLPFSLLLTGLLTLVLNSDGFAEKFSQAFACL